MVSPLWRDEVGAYLSPHRLCLVRMKRGAKPTHVAEHELRFAGVQTDSWAAALEAFAAMLAQPPWAGTRTRVVIADHWARYAIVPWVAALSSAAERLAARRTRVTGLHRGGAGGARAAAVAEPLRGGSGRLGPAHLGCAAAGDAGHLRRAGRTD